MDIYMSICTVYTAYINITSNLSTATYVYAMYITLYYSHKMYFYSYNMKY